MPLTDDGGGRVDPRIVETTGVDTARPPVRDCTRGPNEPVVCPGLTIARAMDEEARSLETGALISGLRSRVPNFACEFSISVGDLARDGRLLGFEAVLDDTRLVLAVVDGFAAGGAGLGNDFSTSLSFGEVVGIVECRRRGAASPRMKFICSLSSELDSDS